MEHSLAPVTNGINQQSTDSDKQELSMKRILAIHGSPRGERSHSRRLTEAFLQAWQTEQKGGEVLRREVGRMAMPHVTEGWIAAAFYPQPEERSELMKADLAFSDRLVDELFA